MHILHRMHAKQGLGVDRGEVGAALACAWNTSVRVVYACVVCVCVCVTERRCCKTYTFAKHECARACAGHKHKDNRLGITYKNSFDLRAQAPVA